MVINNFKRSVSKKLGTCVSFFTQINVQHFFDLFLFSLIAVMAFYMFGPGLNSAWGVLDDHELVYYSPNYHPLGFSEIIPTMLTKTEINPDSTMARYRPVYIFLRLLEIRLWTTQSPFPWYFFRIIIFIVFIDIIYWFIKKYCGRIIGGVLTILVATFNYWNGIFSRLGPSETYAILGCCFFLIGVIIFEKGKRNIFSWLMMTFGTIVAVGSKENMVVFLLPLFYLAFISRKKPFKSNIFPIIMISISSIWAIWIMGNIYHRIKINGSDVYNNSVGVMDRISPLSNYFAKNLTLTIVLGSLLLVSILGLLFLKQTSFKPHFQNLFWGSIGLLALISSQILFYSGSIWGRYNFPFAFFLPLIICLVSNFLLNLPIYQSQFRNIFTTLVISLITLILFIHPSNVTLIRETAIKNENKTEQFAKFLHEIDYYLITNQSSSIVFYGNKPDSDYERIVSYIRFIRSDSFKNKIFIYRDPPANYEKTYDELNAALETTLLQWSQNGNPDEGIDSIKDYDMTSKNCLLLNLAEDHPKSIICDSVIGIY